DADDHEQHEHADLDQHHHGVDLRRLARAADQQQRAHADEQHRRQVEDPASLGRLRQALRDREAEQLSNSSFRYCDQPTATAAAETPYSSRRQAATTIATSSPNVA